MILAQALPIPLLKAPLVQAPLLLQAAFVLAQPALPLRVPEAKLVLAVTPRLFFTAPPFIALLIRQAGLLVPLPILVIAGPAFRLSVATLLVVALSFPLAPLLALLLFPGSTLLLAQPPLLFRLPALLTQLTLLLLILPIV